MSDPGTELEPAVKDLLAGEFHDIICGTLVPSQVELERADGNLDWAKHLGVPGQPARA